MQNRGGANVKPDNAELDFRPLKAAARTRLPPGHPLRAILEQEPDAVPRAEGLVKLETYVRLLYTVS